MRLREVGLQLGFRTDPMLLEASYPGDHKPGVHEQGPTEESSEGAKSSFFFYDEDGALGKDWED